MALLLDRSFFNITCGDEDIFGLSEIKMKKKALVIALRRAWTKGLVKFLIFTKMTTILRKIQFFEVN